ncbi:zinc finger protein 91-like [Frankliniella occidentalis]|uniref:Zinc finger protein 91-like n=1 Tax=Frankliniella occidentalis TaxID=133901 RepID=A0A6J1TF68_FRAOC|nr:zinc finger protein 91-like [Frankliniella occidentalis]
MSRHGNFSHNVPSKLVSSLFAQKGSGRYCDMTLKFGDVERKAHACVVASFSPFVDKWMSSGEVIAPISVPLDLERFSCLDCASKVIDFMYIGKIQIDNQHLEHIQTASEALQVSELIKICRKHTDKNCSRKKAEVDKSVPLQLLSTLKSDKTEEKNCKSSSSQEISSLACQDSARESVSSNASVNGRTSANDDDIDENEWSGVKCPKCNLIFMNLAKYQQHCSTHLGKTLTTCYVCNYASIRVSDVIKHLQEEDHGEKVCSICLLEMSSCQTLKEHLQVHDQTQPFFCLTCNTRFQTRTALHSHIVRHTSETPFVCKECGRGFKWKHGLQNHMVTHSKLKTFLCDECGYSTAHLRSFIDHKTIHSGEKFKCPKPDCQFISVRKESLKHHLMTHTKEKPYQCEVCGQAFSQAKNLRRHAASHDPMTDPEKCPLCPYQTFRSDKFKVHFRQYHKDEETISTKRKQKRKSCSNGSKNTKEIYSSSNLVDPTAQGAGETSCRISSCDESNDHAVVNYKKTPKSTKCQKSSQSTLGVIHSKLKTRFQPINNMEKPSSSGGESEVLPEHLSVSVASTPFSNSSDQNLLKLNSISSSGAETISEKNTILLQTIGFKSPSVIDSSDTLIFMLNGQTIKDNIQSNPEPTVAEEEIMIFEAEEVPSSSGELNMLHNGPFMVMDTDCLESQTLSRRSDTTLIGTHHYADENPPQFSNVIILDQSGMESLNLNVYSDGNKK